MFTRNHWELAKYICEKYKAISPYSFMFKLGSIMPDINLLTYIKGHTPNKRLSKVSKQLTRILKTGYISCLSAYRFGVAIHYLADSFTYAHNPSFVGSIREHLDYEERLMSCFRNALNECRFDNSFPDNLEEYLQSRHVTYLREEKDIEIDAAYIIETALKVSNAISESCLRKIKKVTYLECVSEPING